MTLFEELKNSLSVTDTAVNLLKENAAAVERELNLLYRGGRRCDSRLDESCRYSLMAGGKRVRPTLTLEFCRMFGGTEQAAMPFAVAIEMMHTFSLIHDDLPCMDDDDLRRGKPTNHKVFGEATALLAGDGMAIDAIGVAVGNMAVSAEIRSQAVALLCEASGCAGMVRGQVMDMFGETHALSLDELKLLQARKTGALIRVAAQMGVLAAGKAADSPEMKAAVSYAENIGLAFQIIDDILDSTATPEQMGKSVGSDAAHHKNTFLTFYTVEEAMAQAVNLTSDAVDKVASFPNAERLCALAVYLAERTY